MAEEDESSRRRYSLDRILAISDGVFAFAITLLVLDLFVPILSSGATSADLGQALSKENTSFVSYLLSFFIAGVWWNAHNRNFSFLRDADSRLRWLNLLFLLWIALLPFFTKILDQYINLQLAIVLYAFDQAGAGFFMTLSWWYSSRNHRLVDRTLKERTIKYITMRNAVAPVSFIVSMGLSFFGVIVAFVSWFAMIPALMMLRRLERRAESV
jgi:TMEM175 potassium channel family protein